MTPLPPTLLATSRELVPDERFDLLVHALAQLPDEVTLEIAGRGPHAAVLGELAAAYGIGERVSLAGGAPRAGRVVYPSARNAATAPLRPGRSSPEAVVLDPAGSYRDGGVRVVRTMAELVSALMPAGGRAGTRTGADGVFAGQRIAVVTNLPAPYRIPLFNRIARRLDQAGGSLRVFFLAAGAARRPWMAAPEPIAFEHEFLKSVRIPVGERHPSAPLNLEARLVRFAPTVTVGVGFSPLVAARIAVYSAMRGVPYGVWSGELATMATATSRWRRAVRNVLSRRADFALAYGYRAGEYLRALRPDLPLVYARNTSGRAGRTAGDRRSKEVRLLTVADLGTRRKAVDVLIDALARVPELPCRLTIVGSGSLMPGLQRRAAGDARIEFAGALPPDRVIDAYAAADVFLFPSREDIFGLVLVEAMASGLATVSSTAPGAVADLCVDGENGILVEGDDPGRWARAIERVARDGRLREQLGSAAHETVAARWTMEHSVDAWFAGVRLGLIRTASRQAPEAATRDRARAAA